MYYLLVSLQSIFESAETWVTAVIAMIGSTGIGAAITGVIAHAISKRMAKRDANVDAIAESAAEKAANKIVKKIIGKSINVDISAEVNKAMDKRLGGIENTLSDVKTAAMNTELGVSGLALAQSKSRLLNDEEKEALQLNAKKLLRHTEKGRSEIEEPAKIELTETEEEISSEKRQSADSGTADKNASLVSFEGLGG